MRTGERVSAVYMNGDGEVRRGVVGTTHGGLHSAYANGVWLNFLHAPMEGLTWARGWYTKAAKALRVAVAFAP